MTTSLTIHPVSKIKETTFHQYTPKYIPSSHQLRSPGWSHQWSPSGCWQNETTFQGDLEPERTDRQASGAGWFISGVISSCYEAMRLWVCVTKTSFGMRTGGWIHGCSLSQHFGSWNPDRNILFLGSWYDDIASIKNLHLLNIYRTYVIAKLHTLYSMWFGELSPTSYSFLQRLYCTTSTSHMKRRTISIWMVHMKRTQTILDCRPKSKIRRQTQWVSRKFTCHSHHVYSTIAGSIETCNNSLGEWCLELSFSTFEIHKGRMVSTPPRCLYARQARPPPPRKLPPCCNKHLMGFTWSWCSNFHHMWWFV